MKKKLLVMVALAVLLLCTLAGVGYAGAAGDSSDTFNTDVHVAFEEMLFFNEMEHTSMDINFGTQDIPTSDTEYRAADGDHTLFVADRRLGATNWRVTAKISEFSNTDDEKFVGVLRLYPPDITVTTYDQGAEIMHGRNPNEFIAINTTADVWVYDGKKESGLCDFAFTFSQDNTRLFISEAQAAIIEPKEYAATVSWTLSAEIPNDG